MSQQIQILYRNYKGNVRVRTIIPDQLYYGSTQWHPEYQWQLRALDVDKDKVRDFAMSGILAWGEREVRNRNMETEVLQQAVKDREALEQARVQLAGVLVVAEGGLSQEVSVKEGDYGWSLAYAKTRELREKYGTLLKGSGIF